MILVDAPKPVKLLIKTTSGGLTCRHNNVKTTFMKPCLII
jgi:hypothetical protein